MPTHLVNLDALIEREDFESSAEAAGTLGHEPLFKVEELQKGRLYFSVLRKPDFQRDTNNWSPDMIVDFVRSFLDSELIPSIILWHSKLTGKVFIVDGAHRISALIAWVNDDYGDGDISRQFFGHKVPQAQAKLHKVTQALIADKIGTYKKLLYVGLHPGETDDETMVRRARAIATRQPHIQKVEGDAVIAENSFFKINGNPATIDQTELDIIRARRKPNAIATRALMRAGTGHKYWGKFPDRAKEIEELAQSVYDLLFGQIVDIGAQSTDVPRAGQPYSEEAFRMILDMVNLFNDVTPAMWRKQPSSDGKKSRKPKTATPLLADDADGTATLQFLDNIKKVGRLIAGNDYSGSLGLDQAVYSWGSTGKFHPAALLASLRFAQELRHQNKFKAFTSVRSEFEEFLVRHKSFLNALGHSKGSRTRSLESLVTMHRIILDSMLSGLRTDAEIIAALRSNTRLKDLKDDEPSADDAPKRFSKSVEAAGIVRDLLAARSRCTVCGARLPPFSRSKDHKMRIEDGGKGTLDNLQFTHPYCNSGYKEAGHADAIKAAGAGGSSVGDDPEWEPLFDDEVQESEN